MHIVIPLAHTSVSGGTRDRFTVCWGIGEIGHQVTIVCPHDTRFDFFALPPDIKWISVGTNRKHIIPNGIYEIISIARAMPSCDIILCNSWQMVIPAILSRSAQSGARVVHLIQHLDSIIAAEKPWFVRLRNSLLFSSVYLLPIRKIVVSSWLQKELAERYKRPSVCVPNGVDIETFTNGVLPHWVPPVETIDILVTGRLSRWKGYDVISSRLPGSWRRIIPKYG